jgi:putative chitinase
MLLREVFTQIDELTRRDFMRGAGALAAGHAAGAIAGNNEQDPLMQMVQQHERNAPGFVDNERLDQMMQQFTAAKERHTQVEKPPVQEPPKTQPSAHVSPEKRRVPLKPQHAPEQPKHHEYRPVTNSPIELSLKKIAETSHIVGPYLWAFLASCAHESAMFTSLNERGTDEYFFNKYDKFGKNPKKAKQLGNDQPGDGVKFHGRGFLQITGRWNYNAASQDIYGDDRLVKNPDLVLKPDVAVRTSIWFWKTFAAPYIKKHGGDQGATNPKTVTQKINPGMSHLDRRANLMKQFKLAEL